MIEVCFDSTTEANLRYLYATGFIDSDTILCCPDDYSLGNFKNFSINERYEQLCKYGVVDYGKRNKESSKVIKLECGCLMYRWKW